VTHHDPRLYLTHILDSIDLIESYVSGIDLPSFAEDQEKQDAVVRRIEIMGEAVKKLPTDVRNANPHVPWTRIAGMRDKVIHDYMGGDCELVWAVATTMLEPLKRDVSAILGGLDEAGSRTA
jgi:uncharacterized protein with HEPN domain